MEDILYLLLIDEIFFKSFINNAFLMNFFMHDDIFFQFFYDLFTIYPNEFDIYFHNINFLGIPFLLEQNICLPIDVYFNFIEEDIIFFSNVLPLDV
jgi:hypothetical protein